MLHILYCMGETRLINSQFLIAEYLRSISATLSLHIESFFKYPIIPFRQIPRKAERSEAVLLIKVLYTSLLSNSDEWEMEGG